jgi:ribosomal protein S18 acetylase RimI-like enzyme
MPEVTYRWSKMVQYMVAESVIPSTANGHLRRLDMRQDLAKVADLVELCFRETLDPEGKQYLNEMRRAAHNATLIRWASSMLEESSMPPSGFVWEEDGRLVGNLSLIPIQVQGERGYMIANVATHPDFRGRGIARALTITALGYVHSRGAHNTWLQVREDNPSAIHIYQSTGFSERLRRTSWYSGPSFPDTPIPADVRITKRHPDHWTLQRDWLKRIYPPELEWHIPMEWSAFRPDLLGWLYRFFSLDFPNHWSVERRGELKGVLTWKHSIGYSDPLWLAIPGEIDEQATLGLLLKVRKSVRSLQPLSMNYPAGLAVDILRQAGFYPHQTLIWMEKRFT